MTLQQLRDLTFVIAHGGFRAAARAMDVSQAGLTKSIARLEEEQGMSLIERTAKGVVLTSQGQEFLPYANAILLEADRAADWLHSVQTKRPARVSVGVSIEPSLKLAPAVLADFRRSLPGVAIHITQSSPSELLAALRDNRLEMAVMRLPVELDASDLRIKVLYEAAAAIVARRGHPNAKATSVSELANLEWIVIGDPTRLGQDDASIRELFAEQHLERPRLAAVSDSLFGAISMLLESDCVARLPDAILDHPLTAALLTEIRVAEQTSRRYEVAIVSKSSRRLGREASLLYAMLSSYARIRHALPQR